MAQFGCELAKEKAAHPKADGLGQLIHLHKLNIADCYRCIVCLIPQHLQVYFYCVNMRSCSECERKPSVLICLLIQICVTPVIVVHT